MNAIDMMVDLINNIRGLCTSGRVYNIIGRLIVEKFRFMVSFRSSVLESGCETC